MKKKIVIAAIVALMGVGGYLGHRSQTLTNAGESDLLLANAEALADSPEQNGYLIVVPVKEDWYVGCNCAGQGNLECCY